MEEKKTKRKLTTILSADVKGYSHLMQDNEEDTVRTITAYREVMTNLIQGHDGRVVDAKGDNLLAEFPSVVDAVRCGVEIQKELKVRNAELPEQRRMEFRIGINLGDVIEEEETIYGDGVNIAARLEGLAEGGGICISRTAFDQVKNKLDVGYDYQGEHSVKNIAEPVRVYKVLIEPEYAGRVIGEERPKPSRWQRKAIAAIVILFVVAGALSVWNFYFRPQFEPASVEKMAFPLPKKPSLAVLPFDNLSGDPEQEYLADGITENIITALSRIHRMFVIARNSMFTYKGKPVKVQQVSEDLGIRYVLEGSIQKVADRVRVTAQLIDATSGHHMWAEHYDRNIKDFFDLLDEIAKEIVVALQVKLTEGEIALKWHKTDNLEAWRCALGAYSIIENFSKEANARARELAERAVKLDSKYGFALSMLAYTHLVAARMGWSKSPSESFKRALELNQKALALDDTLFCATAMLGTVHLFQKQYEKAISIGEKSIALGPNIAVNHTVFAQTLYYAGRFEEAIAMAKKALRLHPYYPAWYLTWLGRSLYMMGRYEEALATSKQQLDLREKEGGDPIFIHCDLAAVYIRLGREEEARAHAEEVLKLNPNFSLKIIRKTNVFKDPSHLERILEDLRKAGLTDEPPLPLPDKPSIAVLPFVNMSADPNQEYFSDGITEEIITALSKTPKLYVIARNSTFTYKGKPIKVQQVGRELGVRYVLEGSVRKAEDKVRITAQLVDAKTGHHLWAERYDRDLKDIFALQDEITMKILTALEVHLAEGDQALMMAKGTRNLEAYLKVLQSTDYRRRLNVEDNVKARRLAEEAIALDPDYAMAYSTLSRTHIVDVWLRSTKSPRKSFGIAIDLAKKALSLDDSLADAYDILGNILILKKDYEKGINQLERALELEPNGADIHAHLGLALCLADRPQEAVQVFQKAIRLNPNPPSWYLHNLAVAYKFIEKYDEAIIWGEKAVHLDPKSLIGHVVLCSIYSSAGRREEARRETSEVLKINPKYSVSRAEKTNPLKNQVVKKRYFDALRKAGLPD